jgi:hypothetical protein
MRNNDIGVEGKYMQLEECMLSEVSQDEKSNIHILSLICGI